METEVRPAVTAVAANKRDRHIGRKLFRGFVLLLMLLLALAIAAVYFVLPIYKVSGTAMFPTFCEGDLLVSFHASEYLPGDVCILKSEGKDFIRRIIAVAGDTVDIDPYSGLVRVNGEALEETYVVLSDPGLNTVEYPFKVPEGAVFMMGDNRYQASDSRLTEFGCIPVRDIQATVMCKIYPFYDLAWYGIRNPMDLLSGLT